ncbi:uncharacterized protein [Hyperolius riggenbachi]|uniref:uncharacterized protein isoform X2 n=1 Tax=Hyperolius riggenbachi TaxID=752182 RepID=UPI0035A3005A
METKMEGCLHPNQPLKQTLSSQDFVKIDPKPAPYPPPFASGDNPLITGTAKSSPMKKNRGPKAVLMIKPGLLTSPSIFIQQQVFVLQTTVTVPLQAGFVPPQAGFVPPQAGFVPPQATFVPPQAASGPPQAAFVPPQAASVPLQAAFVPQQVAFLVPQQPVFSKQPTDVRLCLSEGFKLAQELENKPGDFTLVFDFVKANREAILLLGRNSDTYVAIGDHFFFPSVWRPQQEPWKEFYLATGTRLAVLGIICPLIRCLVLVGEDGFIYGYEMQTDITYRIGNSLKQLLQDGITATGESVEKFEGLWEIGEDQSGVPLAKQAAKTFSDDGAARSVGRKIQHCDGTSKELVRIDPRTLQMFPTCAKFVDFKFCICEAQELLQHLEQKYGDLDAIMNFVQKTENALLPLGNHSNTYLEIGDLKRHNLWWPGFRVEGWDELYLPARTRVAVIGVVRPFPTWIVLMGENGCVYAYEHDVIHLIGDSLKQLLQDGIHYGRTMYWQKLTGPHSDKRISWITRDHSSDGGWAFTFENTSEDPGKPYIQTMKKKKKKKLEEVTSAYMVPWLSYESHQQGLSLAKKLIEELEKKSGDLSVISNFVANNQMTFLPIGKQRRIYLKIDYLPHLLSSLRTTVNLFPRIRRINILGRMYPFFDWIVFVSEEGHVYACAERGDIGEVIFLIAKSLQELLQDGIRYTGTVYWRKRPEDFSDADKKISGVQSKTEASAPDSGIGSSGRLSTSDESISEETEMSSIPKSPEDSGRISPAHAECTFSHEIEQLPTSETSIPKSPEDSGRISPAHAECTFSHEIEQLPTSETSIPKSPEGSGRIIQTQTESSLSHEPEQPLTTTEPELLQKLENLGQELQQKHGDLIPVSNFVKDHEKARVPLGGNSKMYLRLCDLSGTEYMGRNYMLKSWEELYLPETTKMEVLGTLESTFGILPCPQWIVLVGEDRHVYAYEDEKIHQIAENLQALVLSGINHEGATYEFPDVPSEDEDVLQQDPEIQAIQQSRRDLFVENDVNFDDW